MEMIAAMFVLAVACGVQDAPHVPPPSERRSAEPEGAPNACDLRVLTRGAARFGAAEVQDPPLVSVRIHVGSVEVLGVPAIAIDSGSGLTERERSEVRLALAASRERVEGLCRQGMPLDDSIAIVVASNAPFQLVWPIMQEAQDEGFAQFRVGVIAGIDD